jgi:hypothetical protein
MQLYIPVATSTRRQQREYADDLLPGIQIDIAKFILRSHAPEHGTSGTFRLHAPQFRDWTWVKSQQLR